jgi:hypothetical protein
MGEIETSPLFIFVMMMVTQALWFFDFLIMEIPRADSRTNWETEERVRVVCFLLFEVCGGFWVCILSFPTFQI